VRIARSFRQGAVALAWTLAGLLPLLGGPAVANERIALPAATRTVGAEARRGILALRGSLLSLAQEIRRRDPGHRWNEVALYKVGEALGRLRSVEGALGRSLSARPLDLERVATSTRDALSHVDRLRAFETRLRQRDSQWQARAAGRETQVLLPPGTGAISGRVTDAVSGLGIEVAVDLYDEQGDWLDAAPAGATGTYAFSALAPGGYRLKTDNLSTPHLDEVYDDVPCPAGCDVTTGTLVPVAVGAVTSGIDFALDLGGAVSGRVTAVDSGLGVPTYVYIHDATDAYNAVGYVRDDGRYFAGGLPPGTHFAIAEASGVYLAQLYQGLPCPQGACDPTTGTAIPAVKNVVTTGIDFALPRGGQIAGQVVDQASGAPLEGTAVLVYDDSGRIAASFQTGSDGRFSTQVGLETGTYFALADPGRPPHLPVLYQGRPCFDRQCDPTGGTAIAVVAGATTANVDFALPRGGSISGRVRDATTGTAVAGEVDLLDARGSYVASTNTDGNGEYVVVGLVPGSYAVQARPAAPYLEMLYDNLPCYRLDCDPTTATPVPVSLGATTSGIDFAVPRGGTVTGSVLDDTTGAPIGDAEVAIYDSAGIYLAEAYTDALGSYALTGLAPGDTFVQVGQAGVYWPELYDGLACPSSWWWCGDVRAGTPVPVALGASVAGIDFRLSPVSAGASDYFAVEPCRAVDTRTAGPALAAGEERVFYLGGVPGNCPSFYGSRALSVNVTVVDATAPGYLQIHAAGSLLPDTATLNYRAGIARSNNAVVSLNARGQLAVSVTQESGTVHVIVDVNGLSR
jgi:hypothetical protein